MKILLCLLLLLSGSAFADCFVYGTLQSKNTPGTMTVNSTVQVLIPNSLSLTDCMSSNGFWVPTANEWAAAQSIALPPTSDTSAPVVQAIEDSTLALTTALACLCFFVGLNSWEASAK